MVKKELINRFDITALQDSFSESAMAAACPKEFWRKIVKRTFQPSKLVRKRRHGYRLRTATVGGRRVLKNRRTKISLGFWSLKSRIQF